MSCRRISRRSIASGFLSIALAFAAPAFAVDVQVAPGDSPIYISGKVGDDSSFIKRISLIAPTADVKELIFYPGELIGETKSILISRQQITLTSPVKIELTRNTPIVVELKITGVKVAGIYKGEIFFLQPGEGFKPILRLPIEVRAEIFPTLVLRKPSDLVKIELIDCCGFGCSLARILQPSAFTPIYPVDFDNNGRETFDASVSVTGSGEKTHRPLSQILMLPSQLVVSQRPVYTLGIPTRHPTFGRGLHLDGQKKKDSNTPQVPAAGEQDATLVPDRYNGTVQLDLPGNQPPIKIPIEVDVRSGPFWPIVVLLGGVLLGRLVKYMKDKGGPQSDLLLRFYQLEARFSGEPADMRLLQPMLAVVKERIYNMDIGGANTDLGAIENRWNVLSHLRQLEQTLAAYDGNPGVPAILRNIQAARQLVAQCQDAAASTSVQQIETAVRNLAAPPATPAAVRAYQMAAAQAGNARSSATAATQGQSPRAPWYARASGWLTGVSGQFRAESTLWLIRPILYVMLVVSLVIVGITQLYLKNPIFGADPLADYFGLAVWAMSSDVASRALTSLKVGS